MKYCELLRKLANYAAIVLSLFLLLYFTGGGKVWDSGGFNKSKLIGDGSVFYDSASRMHDGLSPYTISEEGLKEGAEHPGSIYSYPPTLAALLSPLTTMSIFSKNIIWYGAVILCFILSYIMIFRLAIFADVAPAKGWGFPVMVGIVALLFEPIQNNFIYAQSNALILFLILAFIILYLKRYLLAAGVILGLGISLKFFPLIFVPFLFFRKECKVLLVGGISTVAILLASGLLVDLGVMYSDMYTALVARGSSNYEQCPFFLTLNRTIVWFFPKLQITLVKVASAGIVILVLVVFDYVLQKKMSGDKPRLKAVTVWVMVMYSTAILLIHPHSEMHIVVYSSPAFILTGLFALKTLKVLPILSWFVVYGLYFPLLWVENTPITFLSLVLINLYCAIIAVLNIKGSTQLS